MPRRTDEWIGKTDDTPVPPRVRLRVFLRDKGKCQCGCGLAIATGDGWDTDHRVALINGGANRESNLQSLLSGHHKTKTKHDVATKAQTVRVQLKHYGIKRKSRPMPGSRNSDWKKTFSWGWVKR